MGNWVNNVGFNQIKAQIPSNTINNQETTHLGQGCPPSTEQPASLSHQTRPWFSLFLNPPKLTNSPLLLIVMFLIHLSFFHQETPALVYFLSLYLHVHWKTEALIFLRDDDSRIDKPQREVSKCSFFTPIACGSWCCRRTAFADTHPAPAILKVAGGTFACKLGVSSGTLMTQITCLT